MNYLGLVPGDSWIFSKLMAQDRVEKWEPVAWKIPFSLRSHPPTQPLLGGGVSNLSVQDSLGAAVLASRLMCWVRNSGGSDVLWYKGNFQDPCIRPGDTLAYRFRDLPATQSAHWQPSKPSAEVAKP